MLSGRKLVLPINLTNWIDLAMVVLMRTDAFALLCVVAVSFICLENSRSVWDAQHKLDLQRFFLPLEIQSN